MAVAIDSYVESQKAQGNEILFLDLALGLANYIIGTLFAAFLLAWLPLRKDGYGLIWSAPLSVFCVVATRFHTPGSYRLCVISFGRSDPRWILAAVGPHARTGEPRC